MQNIWLAPMDGYTNIAFRRAILKNASFKPTRIFTEFVNVEAITRNIPQTIRILQKEPTTTPLSAQLFGKNPEAYYLATLKILELGYTDIDINLGCSAKQILDNNEGGALIGEYEIVGSIVSACKRAITEFASTKNVESSSFKLSVKTRLGRTHDIGDEWLTFLDSLNLDFIVLHGRIVKDAFKGSSNWERIGEIANKIKTPLIGNGDIKTIEEALQKQQSYLLYGTMIGRNAQAFLDYNRNRGEILTIRLKTIYDYLKFHRKYLLSVYRSEKDALFSTRKIMLMLLKNIDNSAELKQKLIRTESYEETLLLVVKEFDNKITSV